MKGWYTRKLSAPRTARRAVKSMKNAAVLLRFCAKVGAGHRIAINDTMALSKNDPEEVADAYSR